AITGTGIPGKSLGAVQFTTSRCAPGAPPHGSRRHPARVKKGLSAAIRRANTAAESPSSKIPDATYECTFLTSIVSQVRRPDRRGVRPARGVLEPGARSE